MAQGSSKEDLMKLNDLFGAKNVLIQILWGERILEFPTQIIRVSDNQIFVPAYNFNGKPLELNISSYGNIVCNLFADDPDTGLRVSWRNFELQTVIEKDVMHYRMTVPAFKKMATVDDRRENMRIVIRRPGEIREKGGKIHQVMINDISDNGVGFYAPASFEPSSNRITVLLDDTVGDRGFNVKITVTIVRRIEKTGTTFYGCEIIEANRDFLLYGCVKRLKNKEKELEEEEAN